MKIYFVHIPKTAGMYSRLAFGGHKNFAPVRKDREHKFAVHNATRNGHSSFTSRYWPCYLNDDGYQMADFAFSVVRNPFDLFVSYWCHDAHGTNIDDGWADVNTYHKLKTFDDFINFYVDKDPKKWHVPMFSISPFSQLFDENGKCTVKYCVRYEKLAKGLRAIGKISGIKPVVMPTRTNVSARRKEQDYRKYYSDNAASKLYEKLKWDFETFNYGFDGPLDKNKLLDSSNLRFFYDGPTL